MYQTRFVLSGFAVAAVIVMSGCGPKSTATTTSPAAPAPASATVPATVASATAPATNAADAAATVKACGDLKKDIKENATRVAKAQKIGPPAGHIAVSAQWAAGSTAVIAHSFGANAAVSAAADKVQKEMMALSDAYNGSGRAEPSTKKLDAAIKGMTAACSAA